MAVGTQECTQIGMDRSLGAPLPPVPVPALAGGPEAAEQGGPPAPAHQRVAQDAHAVGPRSAQAPQRLGREVAIGALALAVQPAVVP